MQTSETGDQAQLKMAAMHRQVDEGMPSYPGESAQRFVEIGFRTVFQNV
jgi:hypothetical protein